MVDIQTKIPTFAPDTDVARSLGSLQFKGLPSLGDSVVEFAGVNRLQGTTGITNTGINGAKAHAAVRMHAYPVSAFWAFCPKTKTPHFQRWKVALS